MEEFNFRLVGTTAGDKEGCFKAFRQFAFGRGWLPAITNEIELTLEEWLTNVFNYGLRTTVDPQVAVSIREEGDHARIEVRDNGPAFNPLEQKDPDLTIPAEERPIGGLGIFMMRRLSSKMLHQREGDWNCLVLWKDLKKPVLVKS